MNTETINYALVKYMDGRDWTYGGTICREVGYTTGHKESVVERHGLRGRLVKDGTLEKRFVDNPNGRGAKVLQFRIKSEPVTQRLI